MLQTEPLPPTAQRIRRLRKLVAWCVHLYTALGLVAGAIIAVLIVRGDPLAFAWSFVLMLTATLIDATDGTLARAIRIKEVLPNFDGRRLDDLVDFSTYTFLPLLLIWRAQLLAEGCEVWLLAPLLASAYGFCQVSAKTPDGYFLGFPSYWNVTAFYLYVLQPPMWLTLGILVALALLTFVPSRYLYPSQHGRLNRWTNVFGGLWTILVCWILFLLVQRGSTNEIDPAIWRLTLVSLSFPIFYMVVSWLISVRHWRGKQLRPRD